MVDEARLAKLGADAGKMTSEQKTAVLKDGKVIVSAAAGSGKTTTMLKKIVLWIAEGGNLKRLLVLVYNEAAASDLKLRLHEELFKRACEESGETRARFLTALDDLPFGHISTIHAFFAQMIRENFDKIGVSPTFSVADDVKTKAYQNRALDMLFEEYGKNGDEDFLQLAEIFLQRRSEDNLRKAIAELFDRIDVQPDRNVFFENLRACYDSFENSKFFDMLDSFYRRFARTAMNVFEGYAAEIRGSVLDEFYYTAAVTGAADFLRRALEKPDFASFAAEFALRPGYELKPRGKNKMGEYFYYLSENIKNELKAYADECDELSAICAELPKFERGFEQNKKYIRAIVEMTLRFEQIFNELKNDDNVLSFEDLQHKAKELIDICPELSDDFDAVYVDEYQDVNPTQEYVISRMIKRDSFVVGDVKQSIYGFRLADPTIFLTRWGAYKQGEGEAINFNKNFRSAGGILAFVNGVFNAVMTEDAADVNYKRDAQFNLNATKNNDGAENATEREPDKVMSIGETQDETNHPSTVQVHLFLPSEKPSKKQEEGLYKIADDIPDDSENILPEGAFIAEQIKFLVGNAKIGDRNLSYGDIAVLFFSRSANVRRLVSALREEGIPLDEGIMKSAGAGIVRDLISFLKVLDNPMQDIPLAGFLLSFFGGYSEEEVAAIAMRKGNSLYEKLIATKDGALGDKVKNTLAVLEAYRLKASFKNISDLICGIISDFCYDAYAVNDGELAKLHAFATCAPAKESVSLSAFLSEIFADAIPEVSGGGGGDRVKLATFHGFKGLEAPVVFVVDAANPFEGKGKSKIDLIMSQDGTIGLRAFDLEHKIKYRSLSYIATKRLMQFQNIKEKMRLWYVALTRAKYMMYITASVPKYTVGSFGNTVKITGATSFTDFLSDAIAMRSVNPTVVVHDPELPISTLKARKNSLVIAGDKALEEKIREARKFKYKYLAATKLAMKYSVSALDRIEEQTVRVYDESADVGTAYHKVMQYIDFAADDLSAVQAELDRLCSENRITPEERAVVDAKKILRCLLDPVMEQAKSAEENGKCKREWSFMMYKPAREVNDAFDSDDKVLVQGVVDLYIDGEKKIIVDFKNSYLKDEETLKRYKKQLYLYKIAVESAFCVKVDRVVLYSFKTGKVVDAL